MKNKFNSSFSVKSVILGAWNQINGNKMTILIPFVFLVALNAVFFCLDISSLIMKPMMPVLQSAHNIPNFFITILYSIVTWSLYSLTVFPLLIGCLGLGIIIIRKEPVQMKTVFVSYKHVIPLSRAFFFLLIRNLLSICIFLMFINITTFVISMFLISYFTMSYSLAFSLIIDKKMTVKQALHTSQVMTENNKFKVFALYLSLFTLLLISALTGLLLIWAIPTIVLAYGILYTNLVDQKETILEKDTMLYSFENNTVLVEFHS